MPSSDLREQLELIRSIQPAVHVPQNWNYENPGPMYKAYMHPPHDVGGQFDVPNWRAETSRMSSQIPYIAFCRLSEGWRDYRHFCIRIFPVRPGGHEHFNHDQNLADLPPGAEWRILRRGGYGHNSGSRWSAGPPVSSAVQTDQEKLAHVSTGFFVRPGV